MPGKILAVDDDKGTREFYRLAFEDAGYTVATAEDATSAVMMCGTFAPDLLLLDRDMPGGGGKKVFEMVCELLGRRIPVLFVTGVPGKVNAVSISNRVSLIKKPADINVMLSRVKDLLE